MPIGILQLLAILRRDWSGFNFQFYDANAHRVDDFKRGVEGMTGLREVLEADDWDVVGIGGLITAYNYIKQAVKTVKKIRPEAKIVAGGGFFSAIPSDIMRLMPEIDVGAIGESYRTFPELLEAFDHNEDLRHVNGVVYRKNGSLEFTAPRDLMLNLDWLPYPAYEYAPLDVYFKYSSLLLSEEAWMSKKRLDFNFSISCPFLCYFCWDIGLSAKRNLTDFRGQVQPESGRPGRNGIVRHHSPTYIGNLIEWMRKSFLDIPFNDDATEGVGHPVDYVLWTDENIVAHDAQTGFTWLREIRDELWKRNLIPLCVQKGLPHVKVPECTGLHYSGTSHAGLCKPETMRVMKEIGFSQLDYGLESFSPRILRNLGKGASPERNKMAIKITAEAGVRSIPNQIIMFPDEGWDSIKDMLDAWEETGIVSVPFCATPYPGSAWYVKYHDHILEQYNGSLEAFLSDLEDATKITSLLTKDFTPVEAVGIQQILGNAARTQDYRNARRLLWLSEKEWRKRRGLNGEDTCFKLVEA